VAHPFFDASSFPWEREEATQLYDRLTALITTKDEILLLYDQAGGAPGLMDGTPPLLLWHTALGLLTAGGQLAALCERLSAIPRLRKRADFHAAIDAVVNAQEAAAPRSEVRKPVVLDRVPLRQMLKQFEPAHAPLRVVLVRGPEKSGKSWAQHVFQDAALASGATPCFVYGGMVTDARDLVDEIFATIGEPGPDSFDTTDNAEYGAICRELMRVVIVRGQPLWIAIDDVRDFDDSVREFCDQLGARMRAPSYAQWFRLMLIHYPERKLPTTWRPEVWAEDVTTAEAIKQADVEAYLTEWSAGSLHEDVIRQMAADVMADVDGCAVTERLQRLQDRLVPIIEAGP
jgi:hypothetical protein